MTNEEILKDHRLTKANYAGSDHGSWFTVENIESAMDAARKDEAISFHLWLLDCQWRLNPHCKENRWRTIEQIRSGNFTDDGITIEELYQLFKSNQNK